MPTDEIGCLLTSEQVAERLQVSPRWVNDQARAGRLPHTRLGRRVRFSETQLRRILADGDQQVGELHRARPLRKRRRAT
jgi:excisionase family DNA binding protein